MDACSQATVVPRPQTVELGDGTVPIDASVSVSADDHSVSRHGARRVESLIEAELGEREDASATARTSVEIRRVEPTELAVDRPAEGYELGVSDDGIEMRAATRAGMEYAAQTLVCLPTRDGDEWVVPTCRIRDWPASEWRGLLVDPARGHVPVERLETLVDMAARAKLNRLHLHLADDAGSALEIPGHPELTVEDRPHYTTEEMERVIEYASEREIEVVPEFEAPGHSTHTLKAHSHLRCDVEDGEPSEWTLCAGAEETYEFLSAVVAELASLFPSDVIHLGTDEWQFEVSWDDCETCQRRMADEGLHSEQELFQYFLRRARDIARENGRRLAVWNEEIDVSESPDVPRDVLVQFWVVRPDDTGPSEGNSMAEFLREGFDVVNSYVPAAYVDRHVTEAALLGWTPTTRPTVPEGYESQVLGGETLAWSGWADGDWEAYYRRALPAMLPTFGDRLWNETPIADERDFRRSVARHVLGPAADDLLDVYDELGGLVLPVENDRKAYLYESMGSRSAPEAIEAYEDRVERLRNHLDRDAVRFPSAAEAYADCFEWLIRRAEDDGRGVKET